MALSGIETVLLSTHQILAAISKAPELELTTEEANALAVGIGNVARHYPMAVDPKIVDWAILATLIAAAYGPRIILIRDRVRAERAKNVTPRAGLPAPSSPPPAREGAAQGPVNGASPGPLAMAADGSFIGLRAQSSPPKPEPHR